MMSGNRYDPEVLEGTSNIVPSHRCSMQRARVDAVPDPAVFVAASWVEPIV